MKAVFIADEILIELACVGIVQFAMDQPLTYETAIALTGAEFDVSWRTFICHIAERCCKWKSREVSWCLVHAVFHQNWLYAINKACNEARSHRKWNHQWIQLSVRNWLNIRGDHCLPETHRLLNSYRGAVTIASHSRVSVADFSNTLQDRSIKLKDQQNYCQPTNVAIDGRQRNYYSCIIEADAVYLWCSQFLKISSKWRSIEPITNKGPPDASYFRLVFGTRIHRYI